MSWLDNQRKRHNALGGSIRGSQIQTSTKAILDNLKDSAEYQVVFIGGIPYDTNMVSEKKYSVASGYDVKKLIFAPDIQTQTGQVAVINDRDWLTVYSEDKLLAPYVFIRKVDRYITMKTKDGKSHSIPCVLDTRVRNTQKIKELEFVNLSLDSLQGTIPYNDVTKHLEFNQRFLIDGRAWEVQGFDKTTQVEDKKGLIIFAMKSVPLNEEEKKLIENTIEEEYVVKIDVGTPISLTQGDSYVFNARVTFGGKEVTEGRIEWSDTKDLIQSNGTLETDCDTPLGKTVVTATYTYLNECVEKCVVQDSIEIEINKKGGWW